MKSAIRTIMLAAAIAPAFASAAQSGSGLTRADVRAELAQVEQAGYNPARKDIHYPRSIQQAEARIRSSESTKQADASGYGSAKPEAFDSGSAVRSYAAERSLYVHH
ncbi:DUF4148 domain-containing protein [Burkholderia ubonensis]|uniref:DUF4148 domain-containing protein n=1 Tax=Burkholderia cepacia complex TaxID=87882 RepID=UPI00158B1839|nr:DUF4148 domain-containing protein [Burkholderia cepacia]